MGWLWSSSSSSSSSSEKQSPSAQEKPAAPPPSSSISAPNEPSADAAELQKFIDLFQAEESKASSSSSDTAPSKPESSSSSWFSRLSSSSNNDTQTPNAPRRDPVSESLLPTEMSCRQAFDLAWSCNGLGGQWNAVYRYGEMRSCSEQWDDFWFCMRTKSYSGPVKEEMVRAHYRNKEHAKYYEQGKPNSEDIWEARQVKVAPGSVFTEGIEPPNMGDEEWREMESERRGKIRSGLGYDKS